MKNPTLATVLNIFPGLGYIYIGGTKRIFGILILLTLFITILSMFDPLLAVSNDDPYLMAGFRIWDLVSIASIIIPVAAFMYDAYQSTLTHNSTLITK